jgi:hypothetical protein
MKVELTMSELAEILNINDFDSYEEYDLSDMGISVNTPTGFQKIESYIVKPEVDVHYEVNGLKTTSVHRTLVNNKWVMSKDRPDAKRISEPIKVVDISVPNGECYIAGGEINHNTTPGGELIASHARG